MPLTNIAMAEEALSLSQGERAELAKLLIQSLEGGRQTDEEVRRELADRLEQLKSGKDPGLTFDQVFDGPK